MPDPSINVGLGYVVRNFDGAYAANVEDHVNSDHVNDDAEAFQTWVNKTIADSSLAVTAYRYGLDLQGVAIVADTSVKEGEGWVAPFSQLAPDEAKTTAARAELLQALDALGLGGAFQADPQWLVLVAYG